MPTPRGLAFQLQPPGFGLIQERIRADLFALVIRAILWNQTTARARRPIVFRLLTQYPSPQALAKASVADLTALIYCLGLHNIRARRLISLAQAWVSSPPCAERRYGRRDYPNSGEGVKNGLLLDPNDKREGWEIAHLPGIGPYALDGFRIFFRDQLHGFEGKGEVEPEWQRVVPLDKDLRAYLVWRWRQDGWRWNFKTGERVRVELA
ncbi:DNA glycosylase [Lindgomyces ingoldianus]|uniref:DNA glycosylase n=1 Tax=Lindgomyces ingoldianus TaxID=673940 RepID=A0ACB6Q931_9PLEO|nr:DNA glycosylase [Lindgomyces ingoldianus]KAF2462637.1 DNA glycosylase [Lindgomyces ingoldianus]